MTSRRASEGAGSVLSFTFLDVLMCTMGSLLLLLVVFGVIAKKARARHEGEEARVSLAALKSPNAPPESAAAGDDSVDKKSTGDDPAELARELEQVRNEQAKIEQIRAEAADRRRQEQDRIAHLEEHERRLEHELAQLHLTLEALEATEKKQTVDQVQADAEVKRLKELVKETEERLAEMRKRGTSDKSYAIVPYKGANGTYRRPVFVECTADAVTIQPEGIRLAAEDFDGPLRSGNPLAAAIRAAHEELNARAAAAGQTDMPDAYPLLIVRPDGAAAYAAALDAIRSWDSDYGYEFVESDWKLKYPEPDPRLAQLMAHAVDEARQRQALLAKVAPRRYASRLTNGGPGVGGGGGGAGAVGGGGSGSGGSGGSGSGSGSGFDELAYGSGGDGMGPHAAGGPLGSDARNSLRGSGGRGRSGAANGGNFSDEFTPSTTLVTGGAAGGKQGQGGAGTTGGGAGGTGGTGGSANGAGGPNAQGADANSRYTAGNANDAGPANAQGQGGRYGESSGSAAGTSDGESNSMASGGAGGSGASGGAGASGVANGAAGAGSGSPSAGSASTGSSIASSGASAADPSSPNAGPPSMSYTKTVGSKSAADTRGVNWANSEASRRASAVTRPVKVLVSAEKLSVLGEGAGVGPDEISFQQPVDRVMDQLAGTVQEHIRDWGLAGAGMYWRPTLVLSVAPGAQRQAQRLAELLENSGLDVRLPQATASAPQGAGRATR